jgi:hypothetical protein
VCPYARSHQPDAGTHLPVVVGSPRHKPHLNFISHPSPLSHQLQLDSVSTQLMPGFIVPLVLRLNKRHTSVHHERPAIALQEFDSVSNRFLVTLLRTHVLIVHLDFMVFTAIRSPLCFLKFDLKFDLLVSLSKTAPTKEQVNMHLSARRAIGRGCLPVLS